MTEAEADFQHVHNQAAVVAWITPASVLLAASGVIPFAYFVGWIDLDPYEWSGLFVLSFNNLLVRWIKTTSLVWLAAEVFMLTLSVLVASRFSLLPRLPGGRLRNGVTAVLWPKSQLSLALVSPAKKSGVRAEDTGSSTGCKDVPCKVVPCKYRPPQVVRWDIMAVAFSNAFGKISSMPLLPCCRVPLYRMFSRLNGVNLAEVGAPLDSYRCLQDFFTRTLKPGVRPLSDTPVIVPVDSRIVVCGDINGDRVEQVKGVTYNLLEFLGELKVEVQGESPGGGVGADKLEFASPSPDIPAFPELGPQPKPGHKLFHCVLYLAPADYHRFHSPVDWSVHRVRHFPGTLFPISPVVARLLPDLFALNERVVMTGEWEHGFFSMTAVGAFNVGSIEVLCDASLRTNKFRRQFRNPNLEYLSYGGVGCYAYDKDYDDVVYKKGEEVGRFKLGSTIVLIFEAPVDYKFVVGEQEKVQLGQPLMTP